MSSFASYLAANTLRKHRRKSVLLAVVCYHIAVLGVFKYTGFFTGGAVRMPFVPLGISFFTFQQIWYLREVYAGTFSQVPTPAEYLTYSFFFPTVSSGPILKPENFFPQLREASPLPQDTAAGLYAIGLGLAKKVLLADNLGVLVIFPRSSSVPTAMISAVCDITDAFFPIRSGLYPNPGLALQGLGHQAVNIQNGLGLHHVLQHRPGGGVAGGKDRAAVLIG